MINLRVTSGLLLGCLLMGIWSVAGIVTAKRMYRLEEEKLIPYGPLPASSPVSYQYGGLHRAFDPKLPIKRADELSKIEFEQLILTTLEPPVQEALRPYINSILDLSVEYQIDPFWIISIVMVESDFNSQALSHKNARGLMQLMPDTAQYLYLLMQRKLSGDQVLANLDLPQENLEMGVFYLKKLLQNFRMNYRFATVAYNIGPAKLRSHLKAKSIDLNHSPYLQKISDRYLRISQNFSEEIKQRSRLYKSSLVFYGNILSSEKAPPKSVQRI